MHDEHRDKEEFFSVYYFPIVTILLIVINVLIFYGVQFLSQSMSPPGAVSTFECVQENFPQCLYVNNYELDIAISCLESKPVVNKCFSIEEKVILEYGFSPKNLEKGSVLQIITSMFLHGDGVHLLSNMISLFLVGMFLETRLGKKKYLLLYFICGIVATLAYFLVNLGSPVRAIGASGAIFGLLGASLVLNFYRTKSPLVPRVFGITFGGFPTAYLVITFLAQIFYGGLLEEDAIAYAAHIGGFVAGFILIFYLKNREEKYDPQPER